MPRVTLEDVFAILRSYYAGEYPSDPVRHVCCRLDSGRKDHHTVPFSHGAASLIPLITPSAPAPTVLPSPPSVPPSGSTVPPSSRARPRSRSPACATDIFRVLNDTGRRHTQSQMVNAINVESEVYALRTIAGELAALKKEGRLNNRRDGHGRGYGLPEW